MPEFDALVEDVVSCDFKAGAVSELGDDAGDAAVGEVGGPCGSLGVVGHGPHSSGEEDDGRDGVGGGVVERGVKVGEEFKVVSEAFPDEGCGLVLEAG